MNKLQESLSKCTVSGNVVSLPPISTGPLDNYLEVRTALLKAGAVYKKNTFVFPNAAQPYMDRLLGGDSINRKKELQFFGTPPDLADFLVELAELDSHDLICEPSAGQGAIIEAIHRDIDKIVSYWEIDEINRNVLASMKDVNHIGNDFLKDKSNLRFDAIIANPPFSKNQDIDHVLKMYDYLRAGGRIVTVASKHWQFSDNKKEKSFRDWLDEIGAEVHDIEAGRFKSSGTNVATCVLVIRKKIRRGS